MPYIFSDQLDQQIVTTETLPTVSGQMPVWNEDLSGYYPQVPFINELLGKPLANHATTSGQILRWNGNTWIPVAAGSVTGPTYKKAVKNVRQTLNSTTPVKLTGLSITISIEEGDALELVGFIGAIQGSLACTPWIGYTVDNGTKVGLGGTTLHGGWWITFPIETTIYNLTPGPHTIDLWGGSDQTTYIEAGTSAWYSLYSVISEFSAIRVKVQT